MEDQTKIRKNFERGIFQWYHKLEFDGNDYAAKLLRNAEDGSFLVYDAYPLNTYMKCEISYKKNGKIEKGYVVHQKGYFQLLQTSKLFSTLQNLVDFFWDPDRNIKDFKAFPFKYAIPYTAIVNLPFYFGQMTYEDASKLLLSTELGSYLLRDSKRSHDEIVLSVHMEYADKTPICFRVRIDLEGMERERVVALLTILLVQSSPDEQNFLQLKYALLTMITQPPPDTLLNIRQRLFGSIEITVSEGTWSCCSGRIDMIFFK